MGGRTSRLLGAFLGVAMLACVVGHASANLVANGDFETGDFTGWTQFGDTSFSGVDSTAPQAGSFAAFFGAVSGGGISQIIATTAGSFFQIDFWLQTEADVNGVAIPNSFEFDWDGVAHMTLNDAPEMGYTHYSFILQATTSSTTLSFNFSSEPAFWDFDTVSVTEATVPEPGTLALVGLACALAGVARRRRA